MKRLLSFPPISFTLEAFSTYGRCGVAQAAAALSYFLILTLFPLLMCVNYFIGLFHLSLEQLLSGLDQVLPDQALAVMQEMCIRDRPGGCRDALRRGAGGRYSGRAAGTGPLVLLLRQLSEPRPL